MKISLRFWVGWALAMALAALLAAWGVAQWNLGNFSQMVGDRLLLLAELRRGAVHQYFATAGAELRFWSTNPDIIEAQEAFIGVWGNDTEIENARASYLENNPNPAGYYLNLDMADDGSVYSEVHGKLHPSAKLFVTHRQYYDFFLIGPNGDVFYSVEKERDFATNLMTGEWRETALAELYRNIKRRPDPEQLFISDVQPYEPSNGAAALFLGAPILNDEGGFIGVIALQLPMDRLIDIMQYTSGMGETGETYLVGADKLMRSDSRFSEQSTVLQQAADSPTSNLALEGEPGRAYVEDYRGVEVLSVALPIEVGDTRWAVMAEMDRAEVVASAARNRPALVAPLMFMYGLSLWSVWYWRARKLPGESEQYASIEFPETGEGGFSD